MFALLSLLGAFGQALALAIKKRALNNLGINNTLALVAFSTAGFILLIAWGVTSDFVLPQITVRFVTASAAVIALNVLASWSGYKALDQSALSKITPFTAVSSLLIVPVEFFLRGVIPALPQLIGIAIVVAGAIVFSANERLTPENSKPIQYFLITLICFAIASPYMSVMVEESQSGLFSAMVAHIGIAIGFIPLFFASRESGRLAQLKREGKWGRVVSLMIVSGVIVALLENGPINIALESANASEVFALKRTMPFFALVLAVIFFNERITKKNIIGTFLLVIGSALIVYFKQ